MKNGMMDEILRQRDPDLDAAVEASLAGDIGKAFDRLGFNIAETAQNNIVGTVVARGLCHYPSGDSGGSAHSLIALYISVASSRYFMPFHIFSVPGRGWRFEGMKPT